MKIRLSYTLSIFLSLFILDKVKAQDFILLLNGKEIPSIVEKEDSAVIYYTSLKRGKRLEKSELTMIYPNQMLFKTGELKPYYFCLDSFDLSSPYVYYHELGKPKTIAKYKVFNVRKREMDTLRVYADSLRITEKERLIYHQDTLDRRYVLTEDEMRAWVMGRRSARKNFKSPLSSIGAAFVGLGGGLLNFYISPLPSTLYVAVNGAVKPKVGKIGPDDMPFVNDEFFIEGYRLQAGKIKLKNSLLGTIPGLTAGVLIRTFLIH